MVVTATLLLVAMGIISITVREAFLTSAGRESQYAFYAADTGVECAIYWDVKNSSGYSAFSTSTYSTIFCNQDSSNITNPSSTNKPGNTVGGNLPTVFNLTFLPNPYCATVSVTKNNDGTTIIKSSGYNTCDTASARRVERALEVSY